MSVVIKIENLSKRYRLGDINRQLFYEDVRRRWARLWGKGDPTARVNERPAAREANPQEIWALKDVNLEIRDGDVVGIIGRNGSGKSTMLKILSKITAPTRGRAMIKGRMASLLEVGTGFHGELTGRENVYMNASILGMTKDEIDRKFDEIVDFSGVEKFIDTPVKRYSSGMMVRLAFAVAAHLEPDILVIDEVLAVGDAEFQKRCLGKIGDTARSGRTVLFVSHNAAAVENLCRRGIVLDKGRVVFAGTQTDALARYGESIEGAPKSVAARTDHRGNESVRIREIEIRSLAGEILPSVASGTEFEIWMHFETSGVTEFRDFHVEIFVTNHLEVPLFTQSNRLVGKNFDRLPASGAFVCRIRRLPLPPASYRLSYLLRANMDYELLDALDHALDLNVEGADFFGSGELPPPQSGCCYVEGDWHVESAHA